ncbi:MAG: 1-acyl-sn-glycerol-3-phosphate acyltransferase [Pseudomonadota bacterium]
MKTAVHHGRARHIIDEVIDERAMTFRRIPYLWPAIRAVLDPVFRYPLAVEWADRLAPMNADDALQLLDQLLPFDVRSSGIDHMPRRGPVVIIANHPTGMVDGLALRRALCGVRDDFSFFANRDAVRIVPGLAPVIIPVEWLAERRGPERMRETLRALQAAIDAGRVIVMFPAGGMARQTWRGLKEKPWLPAVVKMVQKHRVPAIPVHIRARNSFVYYLLSAVHKELRDLSRFYEIYGKRRATFDLTFGAVLPASDFDGAPAVVAQRLQAFVEKDLPKGSATP